MREGHLIPYACALLILCASPSFARYMCVTEELHVGHSEAECAGLLKTSWATYDEADGWGFLDLHTNGSAADYVQAYGAGFLESLLTSTRIYEFATNVLGGNSPFGSKLADMLKENREWVQRQVNASDAGDAAAAERPYWHQVGLSYAQLEGLIAGYAASSAPPLTRETLEALSLIGDSEDLCRLWDGACAKLDGPPRGNSHCSVLIRVLPNSSDIIFGHTTWGPFESMTRVYKLYDMPFTTDGRLENGRVASQRIAFSGTILSILLVTPRAAQPHVVLQAGSCVQAILGCCRPTTTSTSALLASL